MNAVPKIFRTFLTLSFLIGLAFLIFWNVLPSRDATEYFNFSDSRIIFGIPHFGDVVSNLAFEVAAFFCLNHLSRTSAWYPWFTRVLLWFYSVGLVWVGIGSCYFHWNPCPETLFWDRLPMAWCFATLVSLILIDRTEATGAVPLWMFTLGMSILSVINVDFLFHDLRPYIVVQFGSMAMILLLVGFYKPNFFSGKTLIAMLLFYVCAKGCEIFDRQLYDILAVMSGHSLKHVAAAIASGLLSLEFKHRLPSVRTIS